MRRYHWIETPQTIEYCVMHCVEDAPGLAQHFQYQLETKGRSFTVKQVSSALQRLKKDGLVENLGSFWQLPGGEAMTIDKENLKTLAEAVPDLDWDSEFENHEQTGFCSVFAKPFEIDGETHEGPVFVERCTSEQAEFIAGAKENVLELIAEIERLQHFEVAYKAFSDKTDWVQETGHWSELGMHRADVLRKRCDDFASHVQVQADQLKKLMAENEELVTALNDILRVTSMGVEAFGIAALALGELGVSKQADNG